MFIFDRKTIIFLAFWILLFTTAPYCYALSGTTTYTDVPALLKAMASKDTAIMQKAYNEPWKLEKSDIPALLKELDNDDPAIYAIATNMLGNLGREKKLGDMENDVIVALRDQLKSEHSFKRQGAAIGLTIMNPSFGGREMVPFLIEAVKEGTPEYESTAVTKLGSMGIEAKDAVPAIIEAMRRQPKEYHIIYYGALKRIGTPEALDVSKEFFRKIKLVRMYYSPFYYLAGNPWLNVFIILVFGILFWWSRVQCKKGNKIICWPLLIPVPFWGLWAVYTFMASGAVGFNFELLFLELYVQHGLLLVTLAGIIPWLLSLWRWRKMRAMPNVSKLS